MRLRLLALFVIAALPVQARADLDERVRAEPGGRLQIEVASGSVDVEGHDAHEVRVEARASGFGAGAVEFELEGEGDDLKIRSDPGGISGMFARVRLRVRVPRRFDLEIESGGGEIRVEEVEGEVRARSKGGGLDLNRIVGDVEVETAGGRIRADEIRGELQAKTSGGSITVADITGPLEVETSGGPIELRDVSGPVEARTSGGWIRTRFSGPPEGRLETSGGGIEVEFPETAGLQLKAETSGGRVEIDDDIRVAGRHEASRVEAELNGGGRELEIRTSGGNIVIRAR